MPKAPRMEDIAKACGVSKMAVSLALRNKPGRCSETLRLKIVEMARQMGYRQNPMVSALMAQRRRQSEVKNSAALACLFGHLDQNPLPINTNYQLIHEGVTKRAEENGYKVETFWAHDPKLPHKRLEQILYSRGIQGVVLAAMNADELDFDWSLFSAAYAAFTSHKKLTLPNTCVNWFEILRDLLIRIRNSGRSRIGSVIEFEHTEVAQRNFVGALEAHNFFLDKAEVVPPLLWSYEERGKINIQKRFEAWYKKHKPDAIVTHHVDVDLRNWLIGLKLRVPEHIALVNLQLPNKNTDVSGVLVPYKELGTAAVDLVVSQINQNERGLFQRPKTVTIHPIWHPGNTLHASRSTSRDSVGRCIDAECPV